MTYVCTEENLDLYKDSDINIFYDLSDEKIFHDSVEKLVNEFGYENNLICVDKNKLQLQIPGKKINFYIDRFYSVYSFPEKMSLYRGIFEVAPSVFKIIK
jgi:hypothetical protein